MRELSAEARLHLRARRYVRHVSSQFHTIAIFGSLALIAAIVFGAVSARPF